MAYSTMQAKNFRLQGIYEIGLRLKSSSLNLEQQICK